MTYWVRFTLLFLSALTLTGCEIIADIFKAGVWTGIILVLLLGAGIVWFVSRVKS